MLFFLTYCYITSPSAEIGSQCDRAFRSGILDNQQCIHSFSQETTLDFQGQLINVLSAPLDEASCSRFLYRLDNVVIKNVWFALQATIEHSWACRKQVFGVFDTMGVKNFKLNNVSISGTVYIEKDADASVGAVFAYQGMVLPGGAGTSVVTVQPRVAGEAALTLNVHSSNTVLNQYFYQVNYQLSVKKLKKRFYGVPIVSRQYTSQDYDDISAVLQTKHAFTTAELQNEGFAYNYLKFEDTPQFVGYQFGQQAGFTIYKGTVNEMLPFAQWSTIQQEQDLGIPGLDVYLQKTNSYNTTLAAQCLDAQRYAQGKIYEFSGISYDLMGNVACYGCDCVVCAALLVAKSEFSKVYCATTCPQGSYEFDDACISTCPTGFYPNSEGTKCVSALCQAGYQFDLTSGTCTKSSVQADLVFIGIYGETVIRSEETEFLRQCPYHLNHQCFNSCPPGYQNIEDPFGISFQSTTCVNCWDLGYHGWKDGKCNSACPVDMVSENGVCVDKCSPGFYDSGYFCLHRCRSGYAYNGRCVDECPSDFIIGRDYRGCFHSCPTNMHLQDGVCVMTCDYGMQYNNETFKCESCFYPTYAWDGSKCIGVGTHDCPYQSFEDGIYECVQGCTYGQIQNGTLCVTIDTSQGDFVDLDACEFLGKTDLWNHQFYCRLTSAITNRMVTIIAIHEISDCNYAVLDMDGGSISNSTFYIDASLKVPDQCVDQVNISIFVNAQSLSNIKIFGNLSVTGILASKANIGVMMAGDISDVLTHVNVTVSGQQYILRKQAGSSTTPAPVFDELKPLNDLKFTITRGGKEQIIFADKASFNLSYTLKMLEFFDDMDNSTIIVREAGGTKYYITSSVQPKLLGSDGSITDCEIGSVVTCASNTCSCTTSLTNYLYGVMFESTCPEGTHPMQGKCYDICPPGYGELYGNCEPCSFYSYNGLCVESCPGSTFGKQCYAGSLKPGFIQLGQSIVKCGQQGTSPYYESGMCVEKCSSSTVNSNGICLSKCPYGSYIQYRESAGQSECVMQCDDGYFAEDFVCVRLCTDARYRQYKECRYDCSNSVFKELCISNDCDIGYTSKDGECISCAQIDDQRTMYYYIGTQKCEQTCTGTVVYINSVPVCCTEGDDFEVCHQYVTHNGLHMELGLYDGVPEEEMCQAMRISNIWDAQFCDIADGTDLLAENGIYNIIGLQLVQQTAPNGTIVCRYAALDVNSITRKNILINVDVVIDIPEECQIIIVGVFDNVIDTNITQATIQGKIEFLNKLDTQVIHGYNVISSIGNSNVDFYVEFEINNVFTQDHANGRPYENPDGQDIRTIKYRLGEYFHSIAYVGEDSESLLVQYYKALQYYYDTHGLLQYNNLYQSIRPLAWNGVDVVQCARSQIIDSASKECSTECAIQQKLLGSACVDGEIINQKYGKNLNQYYIQCPDGTYFDASGTCEPCPLNKYIEQGQCVDSCSDGMMLFERTCVTVCPIDYKSVGQLCKYAPVGTEGSDDVLYLQEGVITSGCPEGFAASDGVCVKKCAPGEFILDGECAVSCPEDHYLLDNECFKKTTLTEGTNSYCPDDYFAYNDTEGIYRCVKSCPANKWAVKGECLDSASCNDPMSYKSETSKRCIPCYVKNSPSESEKCQACTSINRTNPLNVTQQYCTSCNFFYIADTQIGMETKFCTDTCPPNAKFLTPEEYEKYSVLRFPFSTGSNAEKQIECRQNCGPDLYSHELTQTYQCTKDCSGGYKSNVTIEGKQGYVRCLAHCGAYPDENPVLPKYPRGDKVCATQCTVSSAKDGYIYRVKDQYNTYVCSLECPVEQRYQTKIGNDVLCGFACQAGFYATPYLKNGVFSHFECQQLCASTDPAISAYVYRNEANKSCVTGCIDSTLYGSVYLIGDQCVQSCDYYQELDSANSAKHSVQYECAEPCNRYYIDPEGRRVCVTACPAQLKYIERDAQKRYVCVQHCSNDSMYIASGICGTTCPDVYFKTEIVYDNGRKYVNRICILAQQCQLPLATEIVVTSQGRMTHCTYCNVLSLTNSSFTKNGSCVQECPDKYDQDKNCRTECGDRDGSGAYYGQDPTNQKLCVKNCFRDSASSPMCNANNACPEFVTESDPYVCASSCASPNYHQYRTLEGGITVKMCLAACTTPDSTGSQLCIPNCGTGNYTNYPYYKKGYGCISNCYTEGEYYPVTQVDRLLMCMNDENCTAGNNGVSSITNSSSQDGVCTKNITCKGYYYTLSGKNVHRCVESCPLLPANVVTQNGETLCSTHLTGGQYMRFNYTANAYQIAGSTCPTGTITNDNDKICVEPCPSGKHRIRNGTCMSLPTCTKGTALKAIYDDDEETILSFICQTLTSDSYYYYFDGKQYISDKSCNTLLSGSLECKIIDCPTDYYYLHGACTKQCENATQGECIDIMAKSNIFKPDSKGKLRAISDTQCDLSAGNKLIAYAVGGTVIFQCLGSVAAADIMVLTNTSIAVHLKSGFRCAVQMSQTYQGKYFVSDFCADPQRIRIFTDLEGNAQNSLKIAVMALTYTSQNKSFTYKYDHNYDMFQAAASCGSSQQDGIFCYPCASGQAYYNGTCVTPVEPKAGEYYVMYNGIKHKITSIQNCVSFINEYECVQFKCPTITEIQDGLVTTSRYFFYETMCTSGCVLSDSNNCQKYSEGNVYDPQTFKKRNASECQSLVTTQTLDALSFQCSPSSTCPTTMYRLQNNFCVNSQMIGSAKDIYDFEVDNPPTTIAQSKSASPLHCQVYMQSVATLGTATKPYNKCLKNYKDESSCQELEYNSTLRRFRCATSHGSSVADYLSQGIYFPTCNSETEYLVEGKCIKVNTECQLYTEDGSCYTAADAATKPRSRSGDKFFVLSFNETESYKIYMGNKEYQGIICPSQTHYYFRNACFKRCALDDGTTYQCKDNEPCQYFDSILQCLGNDKPTIPEGSYLSLIDFGHGVTSQEIMAANTRCSSSEISLGKYCIQKSYLEKKITNLDTCTMVINDNQELDKDDLDQYCTTDIIECSTYVEASLSSQKKIKLCGHKTEQFDCNQGYYQFDGSSQRFKCVTQCDNGMRITGRFCFANCTQSDQTLVFDKCEPLADCEDCTSYTMSRGKKFALKPSLKSYSLVGTTTEKSDGTGEYAYFACPKGFYYLENTCQQLCPHMTIDTTMDKVSHTLTVCNKSCTSFFSNGQCQSECPSYFYHKLQYLRPYVYYLCEEAACLTSEFTLQSNETDLVPPLCLSKTVSSDYDAIPTHQVFKYNAKAKIWNDLFVGNSECATYFVSPLDANLPICADVKANKPSSIVDTLQFNYDYRMFQYRACSVGYTVIDGACYENQAPGYSYILNDNILKGYDAASTARGHYKIDTLGTPSDLYYRQGNCQLLEYMDYNTQTCKPLPRFNDTTRKCDFLYTQAAYNTTTGLASEAVYFLVNENIEGIYDQRISSESCQIASIKCPTQAGLFYFDNKCVRKCAANWDDLEQEKRTMCREFATKTQDGTLQLNNILELQTDEDRPYYTAVHDRTQEGELVTQLAMLNQYVIHVIDAGDITDETLYMTVYYDMHTDYMPYTLIAGLPKSTCVFGIDYNGLYIQDVCVVNCSIFKREGSYMLCMSSIDSQLEQMNDLVSCKFYNYATNLNMYECANIDDDQCDEEENGLYCNVGCYRDEEIQYPYFGCAESKCTGDSMQPVGGSGCTGIRTSGGQCISSFIQRNGLNVEVTNCPKKQFNATTCECTAYIPCIADTTRFGYECRDYVTCDHVLLGMEAEWTCEVACPSNTLLIGNLCNPDQKGEKYLIVREEPYDMLPWYIALGGAGLLCLLAVVMVFISVIQFRKANANKALRKSKKDTKAGYHERLSRLAADGKQQAKSQRGREDSKQAQKDKAPTARRIQ